MRIYITILLILTSCLSYGQGRDTASVDSFEHIFSDPEVQASFPGGMNALHSFINKYVQNRLQHYYSTLEKGNVYVSFVVEKDGTISQVELLGPGVKNPSQNEVAIEAIKHMPAWKPGEMNGKPIRQRFRIPIRFPEFDPSKRFKNTVSTLSSPTMFGRGYVKGGDQKASEYISKRFERFGLTAFNEDYYQTFPITINTFPTTSKLCVNGQALKCGTDFVPYAHTPTASGSYKVKYLSDDDLKDSLSFLNFYKKLPDDRILIYTEAQQQTVLKNFPQLYAALYGKCGSILLNKTKLTSSMAQYQGSSAGFAVLESALPKKIKKITFHVEALLKENYESRNVIGYIPGRSQPDSFVVVGAHYDHLGGIGDSIYFPGANDNASGTAMMLELAHYFSRPENQPECTVVFMAYSGEEVGLVGSKYFTEHPYFPLEKIKFMLSLDLFGAGSEGITAVNGLVFEKQFKELVEINKQHDYLTKIKARRPTANSDHYFFYKKGVPCFFFYTMGDLTAYHDVYDTPTVLEYDYFEPVFKLVRDFIEALSD